MEQLEDRALLSVGDLDPTFSGDGLVTTAIGTASDKGQVTIIQGDGKVVVAGFFTSANSDTDFGIVRYNADGSLDSSFGTGGKVTTDFGSTNDQANGMALQSDGKIVVAGSNGADFALARYNTNGVLDSNFGSGGKVTTDFLGFNDNIANVVVQSDGKIVAVGYASDASSHNQFAVARYNANGTLDTTFDTDGKVTTAINEDAYANGVVLQGDGKIVAVGASFTGGANNFAITRYNANGSLDTTFDTDGIATTDFGSDDVAYGVTLQSDGKIVASGSTSTNFALARYNSNGSLDNSFDTDGRVSTLVGTGSGIAVEVVIQPDGRIVTGGVASNGTNLDFALARYDSNGSLDTGFGTSGKVLTDFGGGADFATGLAIQPNGNLVAAGTATLSGNQDFAVARYSNLNSNHIGLVSSSAASVAANEESVLADSRVPTSISADGRYVSFASSANNLVSGDTNGKYDVFVKDMQTGAISLASSSVNGTIGNLESFQPSLSANGRYVAFQTTSSNLFSPDFNGAIQDIVVKDLQTGVVTLASIDSSGNQLAGSGSFNPSISGDGRYVTFTFSTQVYVRDLQANTTTLASSSSSNTPGNGTSEYPSINGDGRYVVFQSNSSNLVSGDTNGADDIFVKDMQTGAIVRANTDSSGLQATSGFTSRDSSISSDGRYVVFSSVAANLVAGDTNSLRDVFLKDLQTGTTTLISKSTTGVLGNGESEYGAISANGQFVSFMSVATNLVASDTNATRDVFVKNVATGQLTRVSISNSGVEGIGGSSFPSINSDGSSVVFHGNSPNFVTGANGHNNVFRVATGLVSTIYGPATLSVSDASVSEGNGSTTVLTFNVTLDVATSSGFTVGYSTQNGTATTANGDYVAISNGSLNFTGTAGETKTIQVTVSGDTTLEANETLSVVLGTVTGNSQVSILDGTGQGTILNDDASESKGVLDRTYGTNGVVLGATPLAYAKAIAIQSDNKAIVVGPASNGTDQDFGLRRYNSDGTLDTTFGVSGLVLTHVFSNDFPYDVAIQSDGKIVVAGAFFGSQVIGVARYNADGSLDSSFGSSGKVIVNSTEQAHGVVIQSDGKIVVAGYQPAGGGGRDSIVVRLNADGSLDTSFATGGKAVLDSTFFETVEDVAQQADGKLVVAIRGSGGFGVARFNTNGTLDNTFGSSGYVQTSVGGNNNDDPWSVLVQSDGKILVSGNSFNASSNPDFALVRYNTNGTLDTSFDTDGKVITTFGSSSDQAYAMLLQPNGKIVLGGYTKLADSTDDFALARYNTDGSLDTSFGTGGKVTTDISGGGGEQVLALGLQSDGSIIAGGFRNGELAIARYGLSNFRVDIVSTTAAGVLGNLDSVTQGRPNGISADGRYVVFESYANNLLPGGSNSNPDIFVKDMQTGLVRRVSTTTNSTNVANGSSSKPSISADGRYVAFQSSATNLAAGDTNGAFDVFVKDLQTDVTTLVSTDSSGVLGNNGSSFPSISADGRYVVFSSASTNLVAGDTNSVQDVFVKDLQTNATTIVSTNTGGGTLGNTDSLQASISGDGRYVVFETTSNNLAAGDGNSALDVYFKDRQTGATTLISATSGGVVGNARSEGAAISADGNVIAFYSQASNFVSGDTVGTHDIFVKDRQTGEITLVSTDSSGNQGNSASYFPTLSFDGRFVAFYSLANNLVSGDTNAFGDVFVKDRLVGTTQRVSTTTNGVQGNGNSDGASISADGSYVVFESNANNLVSGDSNAKYDVFRARLAAPATATPTVSVAIGATTSVAEYASQQLTYTLTRTGSTTSALTVDVTFGGTATLGSDYSLSGATIVSGNNATVTFAANSDTAVVTITGLDDLADESTEAVTLAVATGSGYTVGTPSNASADITDNDDPTSASFTIPSDGSVRIVRNGNDVEIRSVPGNVLLASRDVTTLDGGLTIEGGTGPNDTLVIDASNGDPIPSGGLTFDGGAGTDRLVVIGDGTQNPNYSPDGTTNGTGTVGMTIGTINFTGLEASDFDNVGTFTLSTPNADNIVNLANGFLGDGTTAATSVSGTSGGIGFPQANVRGSGIVIDTTAVAGTDKVTVTSADNAHGNTSLNVKGGTEAGDVITIDGTTTFSGTTTLDAKTINLNANVTNGVAGTTATTVNVVAPGQIQDGIDVAAATGGTVNIASGSYTGDVNTSAKSVTLAPTGAVSSTGAWTLDSNDSINIAINGTTPGTQYDQLSVDGDITLGNATLNLSGKYTPTNTDTFDILTTTGAVIGSLNVPTYLLNGKPLTPSYDATAPGGVSLGFDASPDLSGTAGNDNFVISRDNSGNVVVTRNGVPVLTVPEGDLTNLTIAPGDGDDTLVIDASNGDPIPAGGMTFDGGLGTDRLVVIGDGTQNPNYSPDGTTNGTGSVGMTIGTINFTGLEATDFDNVGTFTLATPNSDNILNLANGFLVDGTTAATSISGTSGGVGFPTANVRGSGIVIDTTAVAGTDTVTITSADNAHGNTSLNVKGGTEAGDVITIDGTTTFSGTTTLDAKTINLNANFTNGVTGTTATTVNVTAPGQIQDGIDVAAATGATVNIATGSYTGDVNTSAKSVALASSGAVSSTGTWTLGSNDSISIAINGTTPGTQYDQLNVDGDITLGGATLNVSGKYTPTSTDKFEIINGTGTVNGSLSSSPLYQYLSGKPLEPIYISGPPGSVALALEKLAPTVSSIERAGSSPTNAASVNFTVTFSEAVTGVDTGDFAVHGMTTATVTNVTSADLGAGIVYTVTISGGNLGIINDSVGLDISNSQDITDAAGNALVTAEPTTDETYLLDHVTPTVLVTPNSGSSADSPITFTFEFSEPVTGFDASDISLMNGKAGKFVIIDSAKYTLEVTPDSDGKVTVSVGDDVAADSAGNKNTSGSGEIVSDRSGPVFTTSPTPSTAENSLDVLTVAATDATGPAVFTITGGSDADKFDLTSKGVLTFKAAPDFEAPSDAGMNNVYDVIITATDALGNTRTQDIAVSVTPVSEAPPVFTSEATFIIGEKNSAVVTATTTDADQGETLTFSITGGPDATKFQITNDGKLSFIAAPNFQTPVDVGLNNVYEVTITADDGAGGTQSQQIQVAVTGISVTLVSGNLVVTDTTDSGLLDQLTVNVNLSRQVLEISEAIHLIAFSVPGATRVGLNAIEVPFSAITGSKVSVNAAQGNDSVTVTTSGMGSAFTKTIELLGGIGNDSLTGSSLNEILDGGVGNDTLTGSLGSDTITGGNGTDTLQESGNVNFILTNTSLTGVGTDVMSGIEVASLTGGTSANVIDASAATFSVILTGGSGDDTVTGSSVKDTLIGGDGNDLLFGSSGADSLDGGDGDDTLDGGASNDTLNGGGGTDQARRKNDVSFTVTNTELQELRDGVVLSSDVLAGIETVSLTGGVSGNLIDLTGFSNTGIALIDGGGGNDTVLGSDGTDNIVTGSGVDVISGRGGNDTIKSGDGNDVVDGGEGNDALDGQGGNDSLVGGAGDDQLLGAAGLDTLTGNEGNDTFNGGAGIDMVSETGDVNFVLTNSSLTGLGTDQLASTESALLVGGNSANSIDASAATFGVLLNGGPGADTLIGSSAADRLNGGTGNDFMYGMGGGDVLFASYGNDFLDGGGGNDTLLGGDGIDVGRRKNNVDFRVDNTALHELLNDVVIAFDLLATIETVSITGGVSANKIDLTAFTNLGVATIQGGGGDDTILGSDGSDVITTTSGADVIDGRGGADTVLSGDGADSVRGGDGNDSLDGQGGDDTVLGEAGDDNVGGGAGTDQIDGGTGVNRLVETADGTVVIVGQQLTSDVLGNSDVIQNVSAMTFRGGAGNNFFDARRSAVSVQLLGDAGNDTLLGSNGNDLLQGGLGDDVISGGLAVDTIDGGAGTDVLYEVSNSNFVVNSIRVAIGSAAADSVFNIEGIVLIGGGGNNTIRASNASVPVTLLGGGGNDVLIGGASSDVLIGGNRANSNTGRDTLTGNAGADRFDDDSNDTRTTDVNDQLVASIFSQLPTWIDAL